MKKTIFGLGLFVATTSMAFAGSTVQLNSEPDEWVGGGQAYSYDDTNSAVTISTNTASDNGITVLVYTPDGTGNTVISWTMKFAAPNDGQIQPGSYSPVDRYSSADHSNPRMTVESYSRGCFFIDGSFQVSEVSYDANGNAVSLGLSFMQRCGADAPALTGDIAINLGAATSDPSTGTDPAAGGDDSAGGDDADADSDDGSKECKNYKRNKSKKYKKHNKSKKDKHWKKSKKDKHWKKHKKSKKGKHRDCR